MAIRTGDKPDPLMSPIYASKAMKTDTVFKSCPCSQILKTYRQLTQNPTGRFLRCKKHINATSTFEESLSRVGGDGHGETAIAVQRNCSTGQRA